MSVNEFRSFSKESSGIAATEFAIIMPVLLILMLAGFQLTLYANAARKIDQAVRSMSEMISQATPPEGSSTATINLKDLQFAHQSILLIFPYLMKDAKHKGITWEKNISVNFSSILFKSLSDKCNNNPDKSSCNKAYVTWTSSGFGMLNFRACTSTQQPADDTAFPSPSTLPRSVFSSESIIVVDIVFKFKPTFGSGLVPAINIARTAYIQPRYAKIIDFDKSGNNGDVTKCPAV